MSVHVLEQLVRKRGLDIQTSFAAEAAKQLGPGPAVVPETSARGLRLLAETERQLAETVATLRRRYPDMLDVGELRVRYRDDPEPAEPIMCVVIDARHSYLALLRANLLQRRAVLRDCEVRDGAAAPGRVLLCALVPLSELLGYDVELAFLCGGDASLDMRFSHYAPLHGGGPDGAA
ncbi:translation elongation factors [Thiohalobacter thiocyanaticus]|uniref:Translation elongation factors n=1 Tax=Thiohalobacter thiocyanaticus TaxID=585455 RepID=A0A1Z4VNF7_9GAMM|nr:hypothetical protein [Thiohalobacter thiocyanaticus]BAZ93033.1 translation elongation factors [Thiohalobacter thiocyanaticus]